MTGKPAILDRWRPTGRMRVGQRAVKMLRPVCAICQDADNVPGDWFIACQEMGHDPYVSTVATPQEVPEYGPELPDGTKEQIGVKTFVKWVPRPNRTEISLTAKINSGQGVAIARRKGFILPSELRSPHWPNGLVDPCQFRGCFQQKNLKEYGRFGSYCRPTEAALVMWAEDAESLSQLMKDYLEQNNDRVRNSQLNQILSYAN